jgi:hypothetical protein
MCGMSKRHIKGQWRQISGIGQAQPNPTFEFEKMSKISQLCFSAQPQPASPDLDEILKGIEERIDANGVSLFVRQELEAAELEMAKAKQGFIEKQTVIETIKLLLAEQHSDEPSPKLGGALRTLDSLLSVAEVSQSLLDLKANRGGQGTFALSIEELEDAADLNRDDIQDRIEEMRFLLLPILETRFRKNCEGLASFCDHRPGFSFGRTSAIPALIKGKTERLKELQSQNEEDMNRLLSMLIEEEQVVLPLQLLTSAYLNTRGTNRLSLTTSTRWVD